MIGKIDGVDALHIKVGKTGRNEKARTAYVDVVAQKLEREGGGLTADVAVRYVRLDTQDSCRVVRRHVRGSDGHHSGAVAS